MGTFALYYPNMSHFTLSLSPDPGILEFSRELNELHLQTTLILPNALILIHAPGVKLIFKRPLHEEWEIQPIEINPPTIPKLPTSP